MLKESKLFSEQNYRNHILIDLTTEILEGLGHTGGNPIQLRHTFTFIWRNVQSSRGIL
jgi:hypothetical protein